MGTTANKINELKVRKEKLRAMGGEKQIQKQHDKGKLTARERLDQFFDEGSFRELDLYVEHRCTNFTMPETTVPSEGVITGHGTVNGRVVFAFSQDFTSMAGTLGEMHAKKICKVMDLALKTGAPIVGFNDSGGARIQEGVDSLSSTCSRCVEVNRKNGAASLLPPVDVPSYHECFVAHGRSAPRRNCFCSGDR